jgi:hypothetical protein
MPMEIIKELDKSRKKILCNIILDQIVAWPRKRFGLEGDKRIFACVALFFLCCLILWPTLYISHQPAKTSLIIAVISASITSLSFYVISRNYQYIVDQVTQALSKDEECSKEEELLHPASQLGRVDALSKPPAQLGREEGVSTPVAPLGSDLDKELSSWVRKVVNPWFQLAGSLLSIVVITVALLIVDKIEISFEYIAKFIAIFIVVFSMGQGAYWAIVSPLFTKKLSSGSLSDLRVDPLYPSRTPILLAASKFLSVAAVSDALMVTLCVISLFIVRPNFSKGNIAYPFVIVFTGYLLTTWNFLYPQLNLARIIQAAKKKALNEIRCEANKLYKRLGKLDATELERLDQIMKLYETINKGPDTMINLQALRAVIGSYLAPTIIAILGVLPWTDLLKKFHIIN